jgi:hypothetical protein
VDFSCGVLQDCYDPASCVLTYVLRFIIGKELEDSSRSAFALRTSAASYREHRLCGHVPPKLGSDILRCAKPHGQANLDCGPHVGMPRISILQVLWFYGNRVYEST